MFRTLVILAALLLLIESVAYAQRGMSVDELREMFEKILPSVHEMLDERLSSERTPNIRYPDHGAVTITPDGEMTVTWNESKFLVFDQNHVRQVKLDRLDPLGVLVTDTESGPSIFFPCSREEKCVDSGNGNFRPSLTLYAATNKSARNVAKLLAPLIEMSRCIIGLSVRVCEQYGIVLAGGGSRATTEPDTRQASDDELNDLEAENRQLQEQLEAKKQVEVELRKQVEANRQAELKRQQRAEYQRICGAWTCVRLEDGTILFRTHSGTAWIYVDGEIAPRNIWPKR